ncbi:MAG: YafY family transcriptional regulator [Burkholderiales bacterium]|jgi:predicted DNA-binding transcriptional regulator YafY|nr:YafY family transcriptional regulator [Burkholderiales bacterium]
MRRADRLFQLVQLIRSRRLSTAQYLAQRLEVSPRTVYRDVADLVAQGVPIEGEAGVGYRMGRGFDLPPLMFSPDEAQALVACIRMGQSWLDPALARQAQSALGKVLAALPAGARVQAQAMGLYAPANGLEPAVAQVLAGLRAAVQTRQRVCLAYADAQGVGSERTVRPLGCFYWGRVWTLVAWCEQRQDFRSFRLDRIEQWRMLEGQQAQFAHEAGRTLADFLRRAAPKGTAQRLMDGV